jgi:hypothetical protein
VSFSRGLWLAAGMALMASGLARAQAWQVGVSAGVVNDVESHFHLSEFERHDVNGWIQYQIAERAQLRGTFGSLKVHGANAGITPEGASAPLPDLPDRIRYGTLGVSYEFWEGSYTSGFFAGIGGYRIDPDPADPSVENFRDARETVFGWHVGADAGVQIAARLSLVARLTLHKVYSTPGHSLLTANGGLAYRF